MWSSGLARKRPSWVPHTILTTAASRMVTLEQMLYIETDPWAAAEMQAFASTIYFILILVFFFDLCKLCMFQIVIVNLY